MAAVSEKAKAYAREQDRIRGQNPERKAKRRDSFFKKKYGISLEEYNTMLESQGNKCAICSLEETTNDHRTGKPRMLAVDHCHTTGRVRGLLCSDCNTALGKFKDNPHILSRAVDYVSVPYFDR